MRRRPVGGAEDHVDYGRSVPQEATFSRSFFDAFLGAARLRRECPQERDGCDYEAKPGRPSASLFLFSFFFFLDFFCLRHRGLKSITNRRPETG